LQPLQKTALKSLYFLDQPLQKDTVLRREYVFRLFPAVNRRVTVKPA
jgi:hypothetical protein